MDNPEPLLVPYYIDCVSRGYIYECDCGEVHKSAGEAEACESCLEHLSGESYVNRRVVDVRGRCGG